MYVYIYRESIGHISDALEILDLLHEKAILISAALTVQAKQRFKGRSPLWFGPETSRGATPIRLNLLLFFSQVQCAYIYPTAYGRLLFEPHFRELYRLHVCSSEVYSCGISFFVM